MRTFRLERQVDVTGISGTGHVADGVLFEDDGTTVIHWRGAHPSTVVWPDISHAMAIHGHGGATKFVWSD
jgi:hypothetical protein